jgi:dUTP pyrophosphatase
MLVKFKKLHPNAVTPSYAIAGDAGLDLTAVSVNITNNFIEYGTGIAIEIPDGHVGLLVPRSSVTKTGLIMKNSIGIIDSKFRGEMRARYTISLMVGLPEAIENTKEQFIYKVGERIGQLIIIPIPTIELEETEELTKTERGENGYGSTNKQHTSFPN